MVEYTWIVFLYDLIKKIFSSWLPRIWSSEYHRFYISKLLTLPAGFHHYLPKISSKWYCRRPNNGMQSDLTLFFKWIIARCESTLQKTVTVKARKTWQNWNHRISELLHCWAVLQSFTHSLQIVTELLSHTVTFLWQLAVFM